MVQVHDPLMIALFGKIPEPGSVWPIEQRMYWLRVAEATFDLIYGPVEKIDIEAFLPPKHDTVSEISLTVPPKPSQVDEWIELAEASIAADKTIEPDGTVDMQADGVITPKPPYEASSLRKAIDRPSKIRPEGLPTNLAMAIEAITALGPAAAPQIRDWLRKKYWSGMPEHWTSILWDYVKRGSLARDGINFALPKKDVLPKEPVCAPMPAVKPTMGPRVANAGDTRLFVFGQTPVALHPREFKIAEHLRAAMGKGHLNARFLADSVGIKSDAEAMVRELVTIMNPKLEAAGVKIEFFKGFGFIMKELAA